MPFIQNTYWGSAADEAAYILWELLWDQHGFIFAVVPLGWKIYQQYCGGGMNAVKIHVKDLWRSLRDVALTICQALLIGFLLVMFVWVPYQRARNMETSHAEQITKLGLEKDAEINRLNAQSTTPQAIIKDDASDKIITDLRLKLADSERRNDKAENTIGNMQAKIEKLRSELEQAQGQFRSAIAKQDDKNSKAVIRAQLGGFLGIGHAIWTHCGRRDYRDACLSNDWVNQVKTFLSDNFDSSYVERFEHPRIESALGYEGSEVRSRSLVKLKGHIEFLKEVIKELS